MTIATRTIGIRELKARASEVLREVQETGAEFIITSRGRPIPRIEPLGTEQQKPPVDGMGGMRDALKGLLPQAEWEDFVELKKLWEPRSLDDE